eukprot:scaffold395382_cov51-Prasinocladus_malaysianus.AAC.1
MGLLKAMMGCCLRPVAGCLEGSSKLGEGLGLLCLGEAGIEGTMATRVRSKGTTVIFDGHTSCRQGGSLVLVAHTAGSRRRSTLPL